MQGQNYSIKQWAKDDRPREKLLLKGPHTLSDSELLAILIAIGTREKSALDLAKDVPLMHATGRERPGPYGLSKTGQQFMAGMMALSRELAVFIAPFINSYKRYASLSWAPVNVVWGRDNRTTGFRLVGRCKRTSTPALRWSRRSCSLVNVAR